jgi:hypothetical protein
MGHARNGWGNAYTMTCGVRSETACYSFPIVAVINCTDALPLVFHFDFVNAVIKKK